MFKIHARLSTTLKILTAFSYSVRIEIHFIRNLFFSTILKFQRNTLAEFTEHRLRTTAVEVRIRTHTSDGRRSVAAALCSPSVRTGPPCSAHLCRSVSSASVQGEHRKSVGRRTAATGEKTICDQTVWGFSARISLRRRRISENSIGDGRADGRMEGGVYVFSKDTS